LEEFRNLRNSDADLFPLLTNVLRAIQLSAVGLKLGTVDRLRDHLNPILDVQEVKGILEILVDRGLAVLEEESKSYFITDDGRRVLVIGI